MCGSVHFTPVPGETDETMTLPPDTLIRCLAYLVHIGVLDDDQDVVAVRGNHYLVLAASHTQKRQVILWVQVTNDASGLGGELGYLDRRKQGEACR